MANSKIIPHLWFDTQAKEAAEFYTSVFPDSRVTNVTTLPDTPSGDADVVSFELAGHRFMAISGGPLFKVNPSISFLLNFDPSKDPNARENLDAMWDELADGGVVRMELGEYPFSKRYGWAEDRYGVNWQFILSDPEGEDRPFIVPALMFTQDRAGKAEEAIESYISIFPDAKRGQTARYPPGLEPEREGTLMFADFQLQGQWFAAMDSAGPHEFAFNEAISLMVACDTQEEIDDYWEKLSAVPEAEQCGWLKDKFGVSWQVTPAELDRMMSKGTAGQVARVTEAFLPMKKFDIQELRRAYGETSQVNAE